MGGLPSDQGLFDLFFDLFAADPGFFVGFEFDEFEVDLVEFYGGAVFLVEDGFDAADEHEVGAGFGVDLFAGFGACPDFLFDAFVAELVAFVGVGDEDEAAVVGEVFFEVFDEGEGLDVFGAEVADVADDDGGFVAVFGGVDADEGSGGEVLDHLFGDEAGVGIVPAAGEVGDVGGVEPVDFRGAAAKEECGDEEGKDVFHGVSFGLVLGLDRWGG